MSSSPGTGPAPIEAIDRAITLLETIAGSGRRGMPLAEAAVAAGLNKSTAYRALSTLKARGYVAQDPVTGHYGLGAAVASLSHQWSGEDNVALMLHPALVAISQQTQELAHLGVQTGTDVVYVDKVEPQRALRVWSRVGSTIPAVTSAMGRALLAASPMTRAQLLPFTSVAGMVDPEGIWSEVQRARELGYARESEENEPGIACVGFALLRDEVPVAALSITAPAERMTDEHVSGLVHTVRDVLPPLLPSGMRLPEPASA